MTAGSAPKPTTPLLIAHDTVMINAVFAWHHRLQMPVGASDGDWTATTSVEGQIMQEFIARHVWNM